ncbi:MAG: hydroxymethylbilane synthase, partial [Chlamydiia bacterium]|nr:hydroxymethylbilane synthase [Chlamydiia bacterium]
VLGDGKTLDQVKVVGSSSDRRDAMVKALKSDVVFKDIRGTIERRLKQLDDGDFDAVVMAEAALIRLKLTHRKRLFLQGETAYLQGKLAILSRSNDQIDLVKKTPTVHL